MSGVASGPSALDRPGRAPEPGTATPWPRRSHLELAALPTAPACARGHARIVLLEWGLASLSETTQLVVSELVTNAVQASRTSVPGKDKVVVPVVRLWLMSEYISVIVSVWDASDERPVRRLADPDLECGRGLLIVESLSTRWGTYPGQSGGKVVWAQLDA
jgi:anti-sigma regulatory factor (Ser/Thr protein kinase)